MDADPYEGALYVRELDDGRVLAVHTLLYTVRLCVGPANEQTYDDAWCYMNPESAILAAARWDGVGDDPPEGWHRHINSGRRRPDGDPDREYINP